MNMIVEVDGDGKHTLTDKHFIASGGEGSVFKKNGKAFKIYNDISKMIPVGKIQELSQNLFCQLQQ